VAVVRELEGAHVPCMLKGRTARAEFLTDGSHHVGEPKHRLY
jgi:hypothetical protein